MKTKYAVILSGLIACGAQLPAVAGDRDSCSDSTSQTKSDSQVSDVQLSKLMDAKIQSKSGEDLGQLEDLVIDPKTGDIKFAILSKGGFMGTSGKFLPVPWSAINLKSEKQFTLNVDQDKLKSAPTSDQIYSKLVDPGYTVTIYRFFAVPEGVGGSEVPDTMTQPDQDDQDAATSSDSDDSSSSTDSSAEDSSSDVDHEK